MRGEKDRESESERDIEDLQWERGMQGTYAGEEDTLGREKD